MQSKARFLGHPIHQMLIVFPLGLLGTSVVFDGLHQVFEAPTFAVVAFWMIVSGVVGGLVAAPFGTIDWLAIPVNSRARRIGALHGAGNVLVILLFLVSGWLRADAPADPPGIALALSIIAVLIALVTAWLGGELVTRLGVGVHERADIDAPSSLEVRQHRRTVADGMGSAPRQRD
jgi:uncharacterized membrane protein